MSQISIWPLRKTWLSTWWQNHCWQSQRSDVSCRWPPGLHTSQEGFCPTPLCRSSWPWPCVLGHCHAGIPIHDPFSMPWPWRDMTPSIVPLMRCSCPVPLAEKHPQSIMFPPPCLNFRCPVTFDHEDHKCDSQIRSTRVNGTIDANKEPLLFKCRNFPLHKRFIYRGKGGF